jgi:small subunit ribosomal protein S8
MPVTDPVADMLTRIRNALGAKHETLDVPASKMKKSIASILLQEGFIKGYEYKEEGPQGLIRITLKYGNKNESIITDLKRISKPGLRVYAGKDEVPKVLGGLGVAIISTSKGIMTDRDARSQGVGGEVLAYIW